MKLLISTPLRSSACGAGREFSSTTFMCAFLRPAGGGCGETVMALAMPGKGLARLARAGSRIRGPNRGRVARGVPETVSAAASAHHPARRLDAVVSCPSTPRSSREMNQSCPSGRPRCLDIGGLAAGLPAAGDDQGAGDGRSLSTVDVLRIAEPELASSSPARVRCCR